MKKFRFSEKQIVYALRQVESDLALKRCTPS